MNSCIKNNQIIKSFKIKKLASTGNQINSSQSYSNSKIDKNAYYNSRNNEEVEEIDLTTQDEENMELLSRMMKNKKMLNIIKNKSSQSDNMEIEQKQADKQMEEIEEEEEEEFEDEEDNQNNSSKKKYDIIDLQQFNTDQYQVCRIINHLLMKNKISQKNAFDIQIPNLSELQKIDFNLHSSWKFLSSGLGAGARVYGFKVDNTYGDTIKVIHKLLRIDAFDEEEINNLNNKQQNQSKNKKSNFDMDLAIRNSERAGLKTLEENLNVLNADLYDLEFDKDPTFWRTSLNFDIKSAETMLLNKLPMDADFGYVVDSEDKVKSRVDIQYSEMKKRLEDIQNQQFQQLSKLKQFNIRKQGQQTPVTVSYYEVIINMVNQESIYQREKEICDLNVKIEEGEIGRITLNQEEDRKFISEKPKATVQFKDLIEQEGGLGDQLSSFEAYIRSKKEPIYSANKTRWVWKNKFYNFLSVDEQEQILENEKQDQLNNEIAQLNQNKDQSLFYNQEQNGNNQHILDINQEQLNESKQIDQIENIQEDFQNEEQEQQQVEIVQLDQLEQEQFQQKQEEQDVNIEELRNQVGFNDIEIELESNKSIEKSFNQENNYQSQQDINQQTSQDQIQFQSNQQQSQQNKPFSFSQPNSASQQRQHDELENNQQKVYFNNSESISKFMQLLALQKEKSKEQKKDQNLDSQDYETNNEKFKNNSQQREQEDIYISLGDEEWKRREEQEQQQQQQTSNILLEQPQPQDNNEQVACQEQNNKKDNYEEQVNTIANKLPSLQNIQIEKKKKRNKENYECVIPPPVVFNKEKPPKMNYENEYHYKRQDDISYQYQIQEDIQNQKYNFQKQFSNSEDKQNKKKQITQNEESNVHEHCLIQSYEFRDNDTINYNIQDDYTFNESASEVSLNKQQFSAKKVYLENFSSLHERYLDMKKAIESSNNNQNVNETKYHSKALAEFFGDDLEEEQEEEQNDKNQEQVYLSEDEEDFDLIKQKNQSKSKVNKNNQHGIIDCEHDSDVQIIHHDQHTCNRKHNKYYIQIGYVDYLFKSNRCKIIHKDELNEDLVIEDVGEEEEDFNRNLNTLEQANPFRKGRFDEQSDSDSSAQELSSYKDICEQFLGQDYKKKKKMEQEVQYLKKYNKLMEERYEKMQNNRKVSNSSKQDKKDNQVAQNDKEKSIPKKQTIFQPIIQENMEIEHKNQTINEDKIITQQNDNKIGVETKNQNSQNKIKLSNAQLIQMEIEEIIPDENSDVDIFEPYLAFFEKRKKGIFNQIKQKEDEIEEEFNKLLYSDEDEDSTDIFLKQQNLNQNQFNEIDGQQVKGIDFKLDRVHMIDLNNTMEENHPLYSIKRYLGDQFYMQDENLLTEKEQKNKKYTWGYYSIPKVDEGFESIIDTQKFDMKIFNIGKGTHKIDMRQCYKGQDYFKVKINDDEQEEFQLIQISKLTMAPKTKEDWAKKKVRIYGKRKDLNEIDFNLDEEENYIKLVQSRCRTWKEMIEEPQKRRYGRRDQENERVITDKQKENMTLKKKREILYILQNNLSKEQYYELHMICSDYIHFLELPTLKHFIASKNLDEYFKSHNEAIIDINVDEIQIDLNSNSGEDQDKDDFLKAQFRMDGMEIDFNVFECGLYDALEIERPCYNEAAQNIQQEQPFISEQQIQIQAPIEQVHQQQEKDQCLEQQIPQRDMVNEEEEEQSKEFIQASYRTKQLNDLYSDSDSVQNKSILMSQSKKIKKQDKILHDKNKRKNMHPIDVELYSYSLCLDDLNSSISSNISGIDNYKKVKKIKKRKNKSLIEQSDVQSIFQIQNNDESSFPIYLEELSLMNLNEENDLLIEQECEQNDNQENQELNLVSYSSLQSLESSDSQFNQYQKNYDIPMNIQLSKKLKTYEKQIRNDFQKSDLAKEIKLRDLVGGEEISESRFDIINEEIEQEDMYSNNSLEEQYNHKEYSHLRPICLDDYQLNRKYDPQVKMEWEVKLENIYQEIREKNPFEDFVYLTPNEILLDTINENNQHLRSIPYLNNLNNLQRFKDEKFYIKNQVQKQQKNYDSLQSKNKKKQYFFEPQIFSDFMGMNKKTSMKELIIKIWLFIKQHIKFQDQILQNEIPFSFYDILLNLPQIIGSQEDAEKISTQNIFSILLHLSNLKQFKLVSNNEGQNFYIFQDSQ